jgi:hypothetical protein
MLGTGEQAVSIEDRTAYMHGSKGIRLQTGSHLLSKPKTAAEIAKALLPPSLTSRSFTLPADSAKEIDNLQPRTEGHYKYLLVFPNKPDEIW